MSVIHYGCDELLAMAATCWNRLAQLDQAIISATWSTMAEGVNLISGGEHKGLERDLRTPRSGKRRLRFDYRGIKRAIVASTMETRKTGIRTLEEIRYNLVANNGQDFATVEVLDWLLTFMSAAHSRAAIGYDKAVEA